MSRSSPSPTDTVLISGLEDLISSYAGEGDIPVDWLTPLKLERPRTNLKERGRSTRALKRAVDIAGALAALILLAPLMLLIGALVKCTSRGPAIYKQVRVGLNRRTGPGDRRRSPREPEPTLATAPLLPGQQSGPDRRDEPGYGRSFTIYKFRTMAVDAERDGARLASANDARITPLGRFLRRTRLDETPQFLNVLRGDMSIVGPRPERPEFIDKLSAEIPGYLGRLGLKPGITGLAQILNGYDEDLESVRRKVGLDLLYLQNCCLRNDLKILLRTARVVVTGRGAR